MNTEVDPFSVSWTRKLFPLMLNGVLENVLVCAEYSSKLAHSRAYIKLMLYHAVI